MSATLPPSADDASRDRLLHAAIDCFSANGFRRTSVREICAQAGMNVASVNYYFRSKEALYREALLQAVLEADEKYPPTDAFDATLAPEQRLRNAIRSLLFRLLDDSPLARGVSLIVAEVADPSGALDELVERVMRPRFAMLRDVISQFLGPGWQQADIDRTVHSILGQCLHYRHSRAVIDRLCPDVIADRSAIERTADGILQFSLAALAGLRAREPLP